MDSLMTMVCQLTNYLHQNHLKIVTAESCTGGLIASLLTELPGSSAWFERGFVTYSNLAKQEMLGVNEALIERYGAVSEPVAQAMAVGALQHSIADVSLAVTGIAGPSGGSVDKPVGTVCFSWAVRESLQWHNERYYFPNSSRHQIRQMASHHAVQGALSFFYPV